MSFHYNFDEKKIKPQLGHRLRESVHSAHVCVCFLQVLQFPPRSQSCAHEVNGVSTLPQSE